MANERLRRGEEKRELELRAAGERERELRRAVEECEREMAEEDEGLANAIAIVHRFVTSLWSLEARPHLCHYRENRSGNI